MNNNLYTIEPTMQPTIEPTMQPTMQPNNIIESTIQPIIYTDNLSNYKYKSFQFTLDNKLINYIKNNNDTLTIKTYALSYNIISLKNGMVGLVFNI